MAFADALGSEEVVVVSGLRRKDFGAASISFLSFHCDIEIGGSVGGSGFDSGISLAFAYPLFS